MDLKEVFGYLLQALRDRVAVVRTEGHDLQDEQV
jgi:hypothetical protein